MSVTTVQGEYDYKLLMLWENVLLGARGTTVAASSSATSSADVRVSFSPQHLLTDDLGTAWRSGILVEGTNVTLTFTLGDGAEIDNVALCRTNNRLPWRAVGYVGNPSTSSPIFTTDWIDPLVLAEPADYTYETFDWLCGPHPRTLAEFTTTSHLNVVYPLGAQYFVRWLVVEFSLDELPPEQASYLQVASVFAGEAFRPSINMVLGHALQAVSRSEVVVTSSGAKQGRRRRSHSSFSFSMPYLQDYEAMRKIHEELCLLRGDLARIFVWRTPSDRRTFYSSAFVGTLAQMPIAEKARLALQGSSGWTIQETE